MELLASFDLDLLLSFGDFLAPFAEFAVLADVSLDLDLLLALEIPDAELRLLTDFIRLLRCVAELKAEELEPKPDAELKSAIDNELREVGLRTLNTELLPDLDTSTDILVMYITPLLAVLTSDLDPVAFLPLTGSFFVCPDLFTGLPFCGTPADFFPVFPGAFLLLASLVLEDGGFFLTGFGCFFGAGDTDLDWDLDFPFGFGFFFGAGDTDLD